ncbi:TIM-barrel domain-containing protein [Paenibacillus sp. HJGM_3]|uniref:glycoside hydrolase family 31 protein n=1 Tax=Paenibacillus sp. HJGM_3 TaxID=3379816 RepID=UPI003858BEA4
MIPWKEIAPGVWKATVGSPEGLTPLQVIGAAPRLEAMAHMEPARLPFEQSEITVEAGPGCRIVSLPLGETEKLYGMGLQFMRMNHRGRIRYLRVNSDPKQDTGETHAPVPFYVSDRGYGFLIDTSRIVTVYGGATLRTEDTRDEDIRDRNQGSGWKATMTSAHVEVRLPAEGADLYAFAGPSAADVVSRYNLFCGGGVLPPKWGLGFWHRVPTLYSAEQTMEEALEFRKRDFPCDVIGLEPGWHSASYPVTYEWARERFPDPASFIRDMREGGFRVNLWEHPYVSPKSGLYSSLKPLSGSYTVWGGLAPDYTIPEAQEAYKKQHAEHHVDIGVAGYKLDECDGSELTNNSWMFPAHAKFPSGLDGEQMRQLYGLLFQKMTDELYRSRNTRTYGLVRASNAAASSLPSVLYSDLYDHRQFIRALCNASFSGLLWTPEVRKAGSAEEWVRRIQTVVFSPLAMLNAWGDGTKPWSFPEVEPIVRHYIQLRMRLLPYLYTVFAQYRERGVPPFRAMPLVMSADEIAAAEAQQARTEADVLNTTDGAYGKRKTKEWDDQYMVGDALLVAPLFTGESEREVLLPPGVWYGLETGERYDGGQIVSIRAGLERIPVFVKDGSVLPLIASLPNVPSSTEQVALEWVHFGASAGEAALYDDDGETYDYESGRYGWWQAMAVRDAGGRWTGTMRHIGGTFQEPTAYKSVSWRFEQTRL